MNHIHTRLNSASASAVSSPTATMDSNVIAFQEVPLTALSKRTLRKLSHLLNRKKIFRSEEGYERDWRGLASLCKQKFLCDENAIMEDHITKLIQLWCTNNPKTATIANLEQFLGIIDRWDVSDDIYENLVEDTKVHQKKLQQCAVLNTEEIVDNKLVNNCSDFGRGSDPNILTTSDVIRAQKGLPPQMYDAFVLYADADLNYASEMLTKLEDNPEYNFKLCMKDRDILGGVQFEHVALTQLIEERCKHLIVILTEEFLKSPENKFLVNYTQALQIQYKTRKIVPLLYEESVDIPRTLKIYTHLRYNTGTGSLVNFWSKLANSIKNVNGTTDITILSAPCYTNSINRNSHCQPSTSYVLPTPPFEIPSINVVPSDNNEKPQKKQRPILKSLTIRAHKNEDILCDNIVLRSAQSTGQLNSLYQTNNTTRMSDLPTSSIGTSDTLKKKKFTSKILKKVFSRSNSKLQEV